MELPVPLHIHQSLSCFQKHFEAVIWTQDSIGERWGNPSSFDEMLFCFAEEFVLLDLPPSLWNGAEKMSTVNKKVFWGEVLS